MPLRKILSHSNLSAEDIALLESAFNLSAPPLAKGDERRALAQDLVALFASGVRDEAELIQRLSERLPSVRRDP